MRFHTCYSIDVGPRIFDMELKDIVDVLLKVNAGAFSFEAANPRHEHEYHVFEQVRPPDGMILIPGVISHTTNLVEHPELIAERIVRFARIVGRENVIAGADCGFAASGIRFNDTHPSVAWLKFAAMARGRAAGQPAALGSKLTPRHDCGASGGVGTWDPTRANGSSGPDGRLAHAAGRATLPRWATHTATKHATPARSLSVPGKISSTAPASSATRSHGRVGARR